MRMAWMSETLAILFVVMTPLLGVFYACTFLDLREARRERDAWKRRALLGEDRLDAIARARGIL